MEITKNRKTIFNTRMYSWKINCQTYLKLFKNKYINISIYVQ